MVVVLTVKACATPRSGRHTPQVGQPLSPPRMAVPLMVKGPTHLWRLRLA